MVDFTIYVASAFGLGALHALEPGHGKTVVAAYLVGEKGSARDAVLLGLIVTLTHTSAVIALGLLSTAAAAYFVPERVQKALELVAGALVLAVGAWLLARRRASAQAQAHAHDHRHGHDGHHVHHHHDALEAGETRRLNLAGLAALGVSGGIVPCPAALAVLLAAIGTAQFMRGIVLVVVFSLGLALALVAIGLCMVYAAAFMKQRMATGGWIRVLPTCSAAIITIMGLVLIGKALHDLGVL